MVQRGFFTGAAVLALVAAGGAQAQSFDTRPPLSQVGSAVGTGVGEDIEDIEIRTQRELARAEDEARFGTASVREGFAGSLALTGTATWGNTESVDVGAAGRFTLGQGAINHSLGVAIEYGESDSERDRNRLLGIYDLSYDITPQFYGFGMIRGQYDEFAARNERDVFVGAGPGFRVINEENMAWRIQAGPGLRHTKDIDTGETSEDLAAIFSSRAFYRFTDDVFLTNDTDVLYSDIDTLVSNEFALNSRLVGPLSARVGLRTDYSTDPAPGQKSTDNRLVLGVVYSFQ